MDIECVFILLNNFLPLIWFNKFNAQQFLLICNPLQYILSYQQNKWLYNSEFIMVSPVNVTFFYYLITIHLCGQVLVLWRVICNLFFLPLNLHRYRVSQYIHSMHGICHNTNYKFIIKNKKHIISV